MIVEDPVAEVRSRADIVEIIAESVVLKRSGRNYTGRCPFHQERTPSFNVNPERQIFRCFGCGEGGDVFSFLMKSQHLSFPEALKSLADRYGIQLPDRRPDDDERALMRDANEKAANFYRKMLEHDEVGAKARAYLTDRGVGPELWKRFNLGYAPPTWESLHRYLLGEQVAPAIQEKAALVRTRTNGGFYDYFRNRIIFPIHNEAGHTVGFGARAVDAEDEPKYLNSPETVLYRKGNLLYGLDVARDAIKAKDRALLMEGYMDVITAHANGFQEAVGVLGTALTPAQARVLLRYTPGKRVVVAFDADRAGQIAAERGLATLTEVTQGVGLDARVLVVPEGKDPDAFLRKEGVDAFTALLETSPDLYTYLVDRAINQHDLSTPEGRGKAVTSAVPVLRTIGNYVTQDDYVKRVSQRLGVREESLRLEITKGLRHNVAAPRGGPAGVKKLDGSEAERMLLYFMVGQAGVREQVGERLSSLKFQATHQEIRERIDAVGDGRVTWEELLHHFSGRDDVQKTISAIMFEDYERWVTEPVRVVEDCLTVLEAHYWESELATLRERMRRETDPETQRLMAERYTELWAHCVQLKHKRSNLLAPTKPSHEEN
ncbi:MAG: putative primase [Cyanobacteria bacterium RYN_339]|nr:putative primase [Cyanobacteria bacterium RYN_339]